MSLVVLEVVVDGVFVFLLLDLGIPPVVGDVLLDLLLPLGVIRKDIIHSTVDELVNTREGNR